MISFYRGYAGTENKLLDVINKELNNIFWRLFRTFIGKIQRAAS